MNIFLIKTGKIKQNLQQCSRHLSDETHPKEQLSKIEQEIIKEQEQKKIEDAKIADFNKLISDGDAEFSKLNYEKSIDYYNQAKAIFQKMSRFKKIDRAKQKLKESQDLAEKQSKYDSFISSADQLRDAKEWSKSKKIIKMHYLFF